MPAILTKKYHTFLAQQFLAQLGGTLSAYVFVGRPTAWVDSANVAVSDSNPSVPVDTVQNTDFDHWRDLLAIKRVSAANTQFVVSRRNWTTGTVYAQYDDTDVDLATKAYFVLDTTGVPLKVYKCLWNKNGAVSTVAPSVIGTALAPTATSDGYVWQYLYTITTADYKFLTDRWMPVLSDTAVQNNSVTFGGRLPTAVPLVIVNAGAGYSAVNPITTTLKGDGSGASVSANGVSITGGVVSQVTLATGGLSYTEVTSINVYQAGVGTAASCRAIIPPYPNHGYDPVKELNATALMLTMQFDIDESGKFTVVNEYRRVGLIINPKVANGAIATGTFYRHTTDLTFSANTGILNPDDTVVNISKAALPSATVVDVVLVDVNYVVRLTHVLPEGEASPFVVGNVIKCFGSGAEATISAVSASELTKYSGSIVYVNQRTPVARGANQTEEIKLVLPLG